MRMIYLKCVLLLAAIVAGILPQEVFAVNYLDCDYWYSSSTSVGCWLSTPTIKKTPAFGTDSTFTTNYNSGFSWARTQWSNADISTSLVGQGTSASIVCYGGTREEIAEENGRNIDSSYAGLTVGSATYYCSLIYVGDNSVKTLKSVNSQTIYIVNRGNSLNRVKNVFTHELGHSLGWIGHSVNSDDIMYSYSSLVTALTNRDKRHINQFY